jgi:hypothetical protein
MAHVKKTNFDVVTRLRTTHFLSFLYTPHKMLFFHKNLCTNIECHNMHQKIYVNFFDIFKINFIYFV